MPWILGKQTRTKQPQGPVDIDWANAIASKACAIATPVRNYAKDALVDLRGIPTGSGIKLAAGIGGVGVDGASISTDSFRLHSIANATNTAWEKPTTAATWVVLCIRYGDNPNGNAPVFGNLSPNTLPYSAWGIMDMGGTSSLSFQCSAGNTYNGLNLGTASFPTNSLTVLAGRYNGSAIEGFINGIKQSGSTACSGNLTSVDATDRGPAIGNFYDYTGQARSFNGQVYLAVLFPVALTDREIADFSANPWQIFEPEIVPMWVPYSAPVIPSGKWILGKRTRTKQPQTPVKIDWSNSLTKEIVSAPNFGTLYDAASNRLSTNSGGTLVSTKIGKGYNCTGGNYVLVKVPPAIGTIPPAFSIVLTFIPVSFVDYGALFRKQGNAFDLSLSISSSGYINYSGVNGDARGLPGTKQLVLGDVNTVCFMADSSYLDIYVNGQYDLSNAQGTGSNSDENLCFGYAGGGYSNGDSTYISSVIYSRLLSVSEIKLLSANPWQIFEPEIIPMWVPVTVSVQVARPIADLSNTGWTPSTGTDLYAMIGETVRDDATYISATAIGSICEVNITSLTDPAVSTGHMPTLILAAPGGGGITVRLRQGTTTIATWNYSPGASPAAYTPTLTGGEADSITNYTALRFQFEATA